MRFPEQIPFELIKATVFGIQIFNTRFSSEKRENSRCHISIYIYIYNKSEQLEISVRKNTSDFQGSTRERKCLVGESVGLSSA